MSKKKSKASEVSKKSEKPSSKKSKKSSQQMKEKVQEQVSNIASIASDKPSETPLEAPSKKKKAASGRGKDEHGFTSGSKSSLIYSLLAAGKYTRESILKMLDEKFSGSNNKSSLSTFISDVQKPVGTYSSSRGIKISSTEDGVLFIEKVG